MTDTTVPSVVLRPRHPDALSGPAGAIVRLAECVVDAGGLPLRLVQGHPDSRLRRPIQRLVKVLLDPPMALLLLVVCALPMLIIGLLIKTISPGPIFFSQIREGRDQRPFRLWKFRTMHVGCCDASGIEQTIAGDPRLFPGARFLRRTNLDELPQLLNVVLGEMSLVGPRPHPCNMLAGSIRYDRLVPHYHDRTAVKPGLTGWAQCHALRGPTDCPDAAVARIEHDFAYIQNFSLLLDLRIIWLTIRQEISGGTGT